MRRTIVVVAVIAVALVAFGCAKKAEEATAEVTAPAVSVADAKAQLKTILEGAEEARAGAEKPTPELLETFNGFVKKIEDLKAELATVEAPEEDAATYEELNAKVAAALEGVKGLAKLTEIAMAEKPEMTPQEVQDLSNSAKAKLLEACEYAAPDIAAKMKPPAPEEGPPQ